MENKQTNHWQMDKKISIGNLIAFAILCTTAVAYANSFDNRIQKNETQIEYLTRDLIKTEVRSSGFKKETRDSFKILNSKLDKIIAYKNKSA